jgi:hypothetical protein
MSKICTDLEQSRKLAEILPIESADMYYSDVPVREWIDKTDTSKGTHVVFKSQIFAIENLRNREIGEGDVYAWSLAALLDILPKKCYPIKDHETNLILGKPKDKWCALYWDTTGMQDGEQTLADNPVDACYEMILRLHELKML